MKLKNRRILYSVFIFSSILSSVFVDKMITAILLLVLFMIVYFDKEFRKGTPLQSNILLFAGIILDILLIVRIIQVNYLN